MHRPEHRFHRRGNHPPPSGQTRSDRAGALGRRIRFGLLHGLGFAGALGEVGLPPQAIPLALLFFNVGVEPGQLAFIAVILAIMAIARRLPLPAPKWGWRIAPYAIGSLAAFWVIERTTALF